MWNPPPIPALCGLTTPLQNKAAMAASTALPPSAMTSLYDSSQNVNRHDTSRNESFYRPITEHGVLSELMAAVLYFPSLDGDGGVEDFFFFLGKRTSSSTVSAPERASDKMDPKRQDDGRFSEFCSHQISEKSNIVATARTRQRIQSTYQVVVGPEMAIQNCPHVFCQSGLCRIRVIIHVRPYILYKILFTLLTRERSTAGKRLAMSSTWACRFLRSPRTSFNCH